jgi:hypothetical protein
MKKFIFAVFLLFMSVTIYAQDIQPPTGIGDVLTRIDFWIGAYLPLVALTTFITQLAVSLFKVINGTWKQIISWGVGPVIVIILNLLNVGVAKDLLWYGAIAYSIAVSLGANKAFDTGLLDSLLKMFKFYKRPDSVK